MKHKAKVCYYDISYGDKWSRLIAWLVYLLAGSRLNHVHIELPKANVAYFASLYRGVRVLTIDTVRKTYGKPVFVQTVILDHDALPVDPTVWQKETIAYCVFWHLIGRYFKMKVPHTCGKVTADILRDSGYPIPYNVIEPHKILKEVTRANVSIIRESARWKDDCC